MSHRDREEQPGRLYVVATPIGNLDDMSIRAVKTLRDVHLVAAEDTRAAAVLLDRHDIRTPTTSYHDHNKEEVTPRLLAHLESGRDLALVSEAGTPGVSDPGFYLVREVWAAGGRVIPVPGPCAAVAALSVSGLPSDRFYFVGFPPRGANLRRFLAEVASLDGSLILYESPRRVQDTLDAIGEALGERAVSLSREMTKIHEETVLGTPSSIAEHYRVHRDRLRGEFTLIIAPAGYRLSGEAEPPPDPDSHAVDEVILDQVSLLVDAGYRLAEAARVVARGHQLPRSDVYRAYIGRSDGQ